MGIFKRKDSKNSVQSDRDEQDSFVSVNSARTSNTSLRSPGYKGSGLPASIPELSIAKPPDPALDPAAYLRSIHSVRERTSLVLDKAKRNQLNHFDVDLDKFNATASYVVSIIKVSAESLWSSCARRALTNIPGRHNRETMPRIMNRFLPMAAGSTSTLAGDRASTSCCNHGPARSMRRSGRGA